MNNWRTYLLTSTALVATGGIAEAAVPAVPYAAWTGGYVGGNIAVARMNATCQPIGYFGYYSCGTEYGASNLAATGFMGGGQAGWDWQDRAFVYGVVVDGDFASLRAQTSSATTGGAIYNQLNAKVDWTASFRGRMGLDIDNNLIYLTGGLALGGVNATNSGDSGVYNTYASLNETRVGWVAGVGFEHRFSGSNWSVFAQALYFDFGSFNGSTATVSGEIYQNHYTVEVIAAEAGFNFHY